MTFANGVAVPDLEHHGGQVLKHVQRATAKLASSQIVVENPLRDCHDLLEDLHAVCHSCLSGVLARLTITLPGASPPDYGLVARHLGKQIEAFFMAARAATQNDDVFGALVEERIRSAVAGWVSPLNVTSGAVAGVPIDFQLDGLIWDHQVRPPLVQEGTVAVIDPMALRGVMEIKASTNSIGDFSFRFLRIVAQLAAFYDRQVPQKAVPPLLGILIWSDESYATVQTQSKGFVTSVLYRQPDGKFVLNEPAILDIINFVYGRVLSAPR
jgi:hypothetical protein